MNLVRLCVLAVAIFVVSALGATQAKAHDDCFLGSSSFSFRSLDFGPRVVVLDQRGHFGGDVRIRTVERRFAPRRVVEVRRFSF